MTHDSFIRDVFRTYILNQPFHIRTSRQMWCDTQCFIHMSHDSFICDISHMFFTHSTHVPRIKCGVVQNDSFYISRFTHWVHMKFSNVVWIRAKDDCEIETMMSEIPASSFQSIVQFVPFTTPEVQKLSSLSLNSSKSESFGQKSNIFLADGCWRQ